AQGLSYTSKHDFESFEWNSTVADPGSPDFDTARSFEFTLDSPQRLTAGLGLRPRPNWTLALDVTWINYSDAEGFAGGNLDPRTGTIDGLGWEDIVVVAGGLEVRRPGGLALRAGFNISESAVPEELAFFNIQAPAIQEDHLTLGVGIPTGPVEVNLGYYHVFAAKVSGPFLSPAGPVPGSQVTSEISIDSLLLSLSFRK
ncbi:MAG: outer membrane protein transport protein, partial [Acidobacteria bacterium]|nr:outer membrane protein transport protein [Acidobacteriota bacterium]